ncbi:MAG: hypothetical protein L0Y74_07780 [candidate division Zixibacteria bacterium]|nr:hypothetical protein [candidate division Zixibacteria bacterium]
MKAKSAAIIASVFLVLLGAVAIAYYLFVIGSKTEVYMYFDSSCTGSTLFIDGKRIRTFDQIDTSKTLNVFLESDTQHEIKLSKPGERDIISIVTFKPKQFEYYMDFSFTNLENAPPATSK